MILAIWVSNRTHWMILANWVSNLGLNYVIEYLMLNPSLQAKSVRVVYSICTQYWGQKWKDFSLGKMCFFEPFEVRW